MYLHVSNPVDLGVFHSLYYNLKIDVMSFAFIQNDSLLIPFHRFDTTKISSDCLFTVLRTSSAARRTIAASQQLLGLHISFFKFVSVISWEIYVLDISMYTFKTILVFKFYNRVSDLFYCVNDWALARWSGRLLPNWGWHLTNFSFSSCWSNISHLKPIT